MERSISENTLYSEIERLLSGLDNEELPKNMADTKLLPMHPRCIPDETFRGGANKEVLVEVRDDEISIYSFVIRWDTPYSTVSDYDLLAKFNWAIMKKSALFSILKEIIKEAFRIRVSGFQDCSECGENNPSESWGDIDGKPVCHGCMMGNHGIVF